MANDSAQLAPGARLGPYEIVALIGRGGMGDVYLARDPRLARDVAVKVMSAGGDGVRRARFAREALAISQVNHPHICAVYDVGEADDVVYLVMEFVEGESLDARLRRAPARTSDALTWAVQMASAVDAAHRRGIIHRDLKPSNIMIGDDGVKLLDFGLAKWRDEADAPTGATSTASLTGEQRIVGTIRYMAPEQIEARPVDERTDIFALGATLYEVFTGRPAFEGSTTASISAAILAADPPPLSTVRPSDRLPPSLDHIVSRSLAKSPGDRWQTARDLRIELESAQQNGLDRRNPRPLRPTRRTAIFGGAAAVLAGGAGWSGWALHAARTRTDDGVGVFEIAAPADQHFPGGYDLLSVAPDGRSLAMLAGPSGGPYRIFVRALANPSMRGLQGTEDAGNFFWSPDSSAIAYFRNINTLVRIEVETGRQRDLTTLPELNRHGDPTGMWLADDTIVVPRPDGIHRIDARSGASTLIPGDVGQFPSPLPGADYLAMMRTTDRREGQTFIRGLERARDIPLDIQSNAVYADGYVVYREVATIVARPFDGRLLALKGEATELAQNVQYNPASGRTVFDVKRNLLAYRVDAPHRLVRRSRDGAVSGSIGEAGRDYNPSIAPDGSGRVVFDRYDPATRCWGLVVLSAHGSATKISAGVKERFPIWSRDGKWILYWARPDRVELRRTRADGSGGDERVAGPVSGGLVPVDWSPDGRSVLFLTALRGELWMLPLTGDPKRRLAEDCQTVRSARFSPDGQWVAFARLDRDQSSVWIQPASGRTPARQISPSGAGHPEWSANQRELYYLMADGALVARAVTGDATPVFGPATILFTVDPGQLNNYLHAYSPAPDGSQFLMCERSGEPDSDRVTVVLNWRALLGRRVD